MSVSESILFQLLEEQTVVDFSITTTADHCAVVETLLKNGIMCITEYPKPPCADKKRRDILSDGYIPVCEPYVPARELPNGDLTDSWGCRAYYHCLKMAKTITVLPRGKG